jgi:hypothetical protein
VGRRLRKRQLAIFSFLSADAAHEKRKKVLLPAGISSLKHIIFKRSL